MTDFEFYLRTVSRCNENTTGKFMQIFRKIILIAKNNGWITVDPFANYHIHMKAVDRGYLTEEELERILKRIFSHKGWNKYGTYLYSLASRDLLTLMFIT